MGLIKKGSRTKLEDRMDQILSIAKKNDHTISYRVMVDTLKDKNSAVTLGDVQKVIERMEKEDIEILMSETDEGYGECTDGSSQEFIPADVNITPRNINVDAMIDRLENDEIDLEPQFQRKSGLWSDIQQSRLIESLMLKIPLPTFYFDASEEDRWKVIDGLQRLTAFYNFMVLKSLRLKGMEYLTEFEGFTFDELPRQYYRRIKETQITIYTVENGTPDVIVFNIFKRINTGGLILSPQEIRHALYQGPVTELISRMVQEEAFKEATGHSLKEKRMADREYATRFIAFTELDYQSDYEGNIDSFLIKALKQVNAYRNETEYERIYDDFVRVMEYCYKIFDKYAFRRISSEYRRGPINKAIFELWSICFSQMDDSELDVLTERKERVLQGFIQLLSDKSFASAIKAGDKHSLVSRVTKTKKMIRGILHDKQYTT